ncbi:MAG: hypothetical protein J7K30_14675 [Deltaproteobacteria bacterium]|nr:hypothetical protein [Deltaproteobacteria bacterium]
MANKLNPAHYHQYNVADACSIWNVLSSKILYRAAISASSKCFFCCTKFVYYECLIRPRNNESEPEKKLRGRLIDERKKGVQFIDYSLDIEDLQEIEILENRKRLGKGELSSIIFAKKTRQAFMTDDKKARNLAESVLDNTMIQTTPHLFGWLFYSNILNDSDKNGIIKEHSEFRTTQWGNLSKFFEIMYNKALEYKLMHRHGSKN